MSQNTEAVRLITNARNRLAKDYQDQFNGVMYYSRIDLTTFNVLDMMNVSESTIDIDTLRTYLPVLYSGIIDKETIISLLVEYDAKFICDFKRGMIFQKPEEDKFYFDYVALAKKEGPIVKDTTISDKVEGTMSNNLDNLYAKRELKLEEYLSNSAIKVKDTFDIYDNHEVITAATVHRERMDKSEDIYNG